jgi:antitoxin (DNA-binding transcriptional repressor) of toxin-antitoxin stability system
MKNKDRRFFNIHEAKTHLSRIAEIVAAGTEITIGKAGKPMMILSPYKEPLMRPRELGFAKASVTIKDEFYKELSEEDFGDML